MSLNRLETVLKARDKLRNNIQLGKWDDDDQKQAAAMERLSQYENSIELLQGGASRREETPNVGLPGVTINCGPDE